MAGHDRHGTTRITALCRHDPERAASELMDAGELTGWRMPAMAALLGCSIPTLYRALRAVSVTPDRRQARMEGR